MDYYEAGEGGKQFFYDSKILVIGAGGLGCELLKSLALTGFRNIDVIDMDTIDVSNLNRQFLFRSSDVGKPKSVAAANFIKNRIPSCNITAHHCMIQDMPDEFYMGFNVIIGGLDSIKARNWISEKLCDIARNNPEMVIPYIDGGTEEWKGHVMMVYPTQTACMKCFEELFPPQIQYQLCTIATSPRQPEHCVAWAKDIAWPKERYDEKIDGDNDDHINWILEKAEEHAARFGISGLAFSMARGVVKHIIPAIASTQAIIASLCATEALKLVTARAPNINNCLMVSSNTRVHTVHYIFDKKPNCPVCSRKYAEISRIAGETVAQFRERVSTEYGYTNPSLSTSDFKIYLGFLPATHANLNLPIDQFVPDSNIVLVITSLSKETPLEAVLID